MKRIAIIGGGIAGLSAAWYLEKARQNGADLEWILFEKSDRLGGVIQTEQRDRLQAALQQRGVETAIHYPLPAHLQPVYQGLAEPGSLPITERLAGTVLSLPIYPELTDAEIDAVAAAVREALA